MTKTIAQRLKEERKSIGLTQKSLADIGMVALSSQKNYESDDCPNCPDANYFNNIACHIDISYILTGERLQSSKGSVISSIERFRNTIGERLKEERVNAKLTQKEFSAIGHVTDQSQRNYELNKRVPDANYLFNCSTYIDTNYVVTGDRPKEVEQRHPQNIENLVALNILFDQLDQRLRQYDNKEINALANIIKDQLNTIGGNHD